MSSASPLPGCIRVCQLPHRTRLDGAWAAARVPLRATPHRLALYRDAGLLAVAVARAMPSR